MIRSFVRGGGRDQTSTEPRGSMSSSTKVAHRRSEIFADGKPLTPPKSNILYIMKTFRLILGTFILVVGAIISRADVMTELNRTSVNLNTQAQTNDGRTRVLTARARAGAKMLLHP